MNVLLLSLGQPYQSPWWLTYKQAQELGGNVRKGERSSIVTFWKRADAKRDEEGESGTDQAAPERRAPILRYYQVFNLEQCEGIEAPPSPEFEPKAHERIAGCEAIVAGMPQRPTLQRDPRQAYYAPTLDFVAIPDLSQFESAESYYATLFHELVHSTGHASRLNRTTLPTTLAPFGSPDYSKEELVAEFGAAFLCGHAGIFPHVAENSAAYIDGWLRVLKQDKRLLPVAAAQAQRAADFILGLRSEGEETEHAASSSTPTAGTIPPPATPEQLDIRRVAALIAAEPDFQAGAHTFPRCRERNREGWTYRFQPSRENPNRVVESFIRLAPDALDRAYELARAFHRGEIDLNTLL
jgi:antirestriction protein ArdC